MIKWWSNLSVSSKLYCVVGAMALLIAVELFTLYFAMTTLSAVRAFVGGEGLWSKAQKTAVSNLQRYATTKDEKFFLLFTQNMSIPLGDNKARRELEKPVMNLQEVTDGFLQGQNHPDDIPPMIHLVRRFYNVPHLARAIEKWQIGDKLIFDLQELAYQLKKNIHSSSIIIENIMDQIYQLDDQITIAENEFSYQLGKASRWLEQVLMLVLLLAVISIEGTGLLLTVSFSRGLTKSLKELNTAAEQVGKGNFTTKVPIRSGDELGQLAESLNRMIANLKLQINERQHAEQASETKNLFLANISHEIRTPLNAILGFSEVLADPNLSATEREKYAAIIERTGNTLTSIINDILDVSKVEAEHIEIHLRPIFLSQLLLDLSSFLKLHCQEKGIQLYFEKSGDISDCIESDPVRLRQILANVIGNSIKFTEKGSVTVNYFIENNMLTFTVTDTGPGITIEQQKKLFQPFSQGDDSIQKKYGGTGLGLLISQRLAKILGGDVILAKSNIGVGSVFKITIPYKGLKAETIEESSSSERSVIELRTHRLQGKRILIIEDSEDNQTLAKIYLERNGAQIFSAYNGQEGIDMVSKNSFDIILMDIQMPIMDGYTATQELRKRGCQLPIIALTGYAMKHDQEKCLQVGCNDFLSKPFSGKALIEKVSRYVNADAITKI